MTPAMVVEAAPAKINLFLHVLGRRPDGYHLLDSLTVFAGIGDTVTAEPALGSEHGLSLDVTGAFAGTLMRDLTTVGHEDLLTRAARLLADTVGCKPQARLRLDKALPVASGIGGGSADAAATLRALSRLWQVSVPAAARHSMALRLGADVPVCLASRPMRMGGIGERLTPAPALPSFGLALVNPGVAVATPAAFRALTGRFSPPALLPQAWPDAASLAETLHACTNDLEVPAIGLCPEVAAALAALRAAPDCLLARMSGSGATCFGLFATPQQAEAAAAAIRHPGWWCWGGGLHHPAHAEG